MGCPTHRGVEKKMHVKTLTNLYKSRAIKLHAPNLNYYTYRYNHYIIAILDMLKNNNQKTITTRGLATYVMGDDYTYRVAHKVMNMLTCFGIIILCEGKLYKQKGRIGRCYTYNPKLNLKELDNFCGILRSGGVVVSTFATSFSVDLNICNKHKVFINPNTMPNNRLIEKKALIEYIAKKILENKYMLKSEIIQLIIIYRSCTKAKANRELSSFSHYLCHNFNLKVVRVNNTLKQNINLNLPPKAFPLIYISVLAYL